MIIYLIKKDESPYVMAHARESLNFQITLVILFLILALTVIGILFFWIVGIIDLVLVIVATIRANDGLLYRYPFNIRFVR